MIAPLKKKFQKIVELFRPSEEREQLYYLLSSADPKAPLSDRVFWLEQLVLWIRTSSPHRHDFDLGTGQLHNARIRFVLHLLERQPEWKPNVSATLRTLVRETSARSLFSQVGLGQQKGFLAEASELVMKAVLPQPPMEHDLSELFVRIFKNEEDAQWIRHIPSGLMGQLLELIREGDRSPETLFSGWHRDLGEALLILGARVASLGTSPEVIGRLKMTDLAEYPFLRLNYEVAQLVDASSGSTEEANLARRCFSTIEEAKREIKKVYRALEEQGVSVALVYTLENLTRSLGRIQLIILLWLPPDDHTPDLVTRAMGHLVEERLSQGTLGHLISSNLHLISMKIVERTGASGEHYISRTRKEYYRMIRDGLGGGGVMVFTTLAKFWLASLHLPLLFEGLFFSLNYATGFVVLQLAGFTLATKQPSATASALAVKLKEFEEEGEVREFVNEVCRMTRTQFAALVGNLTLLLPLSVALDVASYFILGSHLFPESTAKYVLKSLDPVRSLTLPMAVLTGVYLWLSSLAAGWLENWVVFRKLPEALSSNRRLVRVFGKSGAAKVGQWLQDNATLLGGNLSLGFMMGFTAVTGKMVGLPLDVRHITLSAASLTFSFCTLFRSGLTLPEVLLPCIGVLLVGMLNFAVGYSLAFAVAVRAREVHGGALRRLFNAVRVRFRNRTLDFFRPPAKRREARRPS